MSCSPLRGNCLTRLIILHVLNAAAEGEVSVPAPALSRFPSTVHPGSSPICYLFPSEFILFHTFIHLSIAQIK
jgi:hypothetical protein